jgi:stage II sporulation protein D (peptidoglycan lytic transglycosylase)
MPDRRAAIPCVCALAVAALLNPACVAPHTPAATRWPAPAVVDLPRAIRVQTAGRVVSVPLEEYVLGSALAEVSPVGEPPATTERIFEVQAVLARTYAISHLGRHAEEGFDLCDGTHCQLYQPARIGTSRFAETAKAAVRLTEGEVLLYHGQPAEALFHADCGGHTASAGDVWGGTPVPYLVGMPDEVPAGTHRTWSLDVTSARLRAALNADARSRVGERLTGVRVAARDQGGRATVVEVTGTRTVTLRGEQFRSIVSAAFGARSLQSTRFVVRRSGAAYHFDGTGYGHGVGLCQVGAAARARRGESIEEILSAYFPGTVVARGR